MAFKTTLRLQRTTRVSRGSSAVTLTRLILERLADLGEGLIDSFFPAKYPEARMWRNLLELDATYQFKRKTFAVILSRLQSEGLVEHPKTNPRAWRLSSRGSKYLIKESRNEHIDLPPLDGIGRLVIFDIPEDERKKRQVIRAGLIAAEFSPLQKSVWYGERPLPKDFLELVDTLALAKCIHIFSIRERGTLASRS